MLGERGAVVAYHHSFLPEIPSTREHREFAGRRSTTLTAEALGEIDAALICTDHDAVGYAVLFEACPLVIDTRNVCVRLGLTGEAILKA